MTSSSETSYMFSTLVELLRYRAVNQPEQLAYAFMLEDGTEKRYTYAELDQKARAFAVHLLQHHSVGERALLLYQPGLEYITSFYGCLYAGILPVPAYPPRLNVNLHRLVSIVVDADATIALTTGSILSNVKNRFADSPRLSEMNWLIIDDLDEELAKQWVEPDITSDSLAFLQYTSGSTSSPKGVMLSHGNLLHNMEMFHRGFKTIPEDRWVIWLPPYHDMGLIGGILQPLYQGSPVWLMAPADFIQRPLGWLEAISRLKGTFSGAPNFAYDLCVKKVTPEQRDQLDLSSMRVAFSGAEPIRPETFENFAEYFAPTGFVKTALQSGYGLAEGTLYVSSGSFTEVPAYQSFDGDALKGNRAIGLDVATEADRTLVSCGPVTEQGQRIAVVDPTTLLELEEGHVGEIWVCGGSVAQGYWDRPEATEETFRAYLADTKEGPFLRTGDLGFVYDGELYVTGRMKDVIIIRGRNYYPQDIEYAVQDSHIAVHNGNGASFSVDIDGEERLVVVQEMERAHRRTNGMEVVRAIRAKVAEEHQLQVYAVVLLKPASISKTSSGKVQRRACKERFLNGTLDVMFADVLDAEYEVAAATETADDAPEVSVERDALLSMEQEQRGQVLRQYLWQQAARVLRVRQTSLPVEESLNSLGLDSMMAVELRHELDERLGVNLPLSALLDGPSVNQLVEAVASRLANGAAQTVAHTERARQDEFPLSHGQQAMYFLQRLEPESAAYNVAAAIRITSELDADALRDAFVNMTARHPQLRTSFVQRDEMPVQVVRKTAEVCYALEDATSWTEEALQARLTAESTRPFDLERDPLFRAHLFKRGAEHVLLLTVHHIVFDFWSLSTLIKELPGLYSAARGGVELPELNWQFADYVAEQQTKLAGVRGDELRAYWEQQLSGELPVLNLPTDYPRPPVQTYNGDACSFVLQGDLSEKLRKVAKEQGVTQYMLLLAAYQVFLHRYTGQDELIVGSASTGRTAAKETDVMGYFVNPVAIRGDFSESQTFAHYLQQVRKNVLGALEHQDLPFPALVDHLKPQRDPSYSPVFQTMFTYQKSHLAELDGLTGIVLGEPGAQLNVGGLMFESMKLPQKFVQFDIVLTMGEMNGAFVGKWEYNTDLFKRETAERMVAHFENLLVSIAEQSAAEVGQLALMQPEEIDTLLTAWNDTAAPYRADVCAHQLFEEQTARTPDAVAVEFEGQTLTYRELNVRSNQLARHLQAMGAGPEVVIGLCLERSPEMLVAVLGVLKSGAAYLPIDLSTPTERIAFMLDDANVQVLITQAAHAENMPQGIAPLLLIDQEWDIISKQGSDNTESGVKADNLVYVIYTSGSTGLPKGTMILHRGLTNYLQWAVQTYEVEQGDGALLHSSIAFDMMVTSLYTPLLAGKKVVLIPEQAGVEALGSYLTGEHRFSLVKITPAHLLVLSNQFSGAEVSNRVNKMVIGGEALTAEHVAFFRQFAPETALINEYGPTETVVGCSIYEVQGGEGATMPIGRPIANTQMYVLDVHMQPVPVGVTGELYIGGDGVARGYLNRAELNEERFIQNPFRQESGARLYRTGDLGRYRADGQLEYLGRIDDQVKVRGYRIELGEIEATLDKHPQVNECVVIVREDVVGEKKIVAYVVADEQQAPSAGDLRAHVKATLPEYMVPSAFVPLSALPLTRNGKVDRKALPAPDRLAQTETVYAAPTTEMEQLLADVWAGVLRTEQVGVHDNFFELGGDSILSIQIVHRAAQHGVRITPKDMFKHQTIASLAEVATRITAEVTAEQGIVTGDVRLTPVQRWFFEQEYAEADHWNFPLLLEAKQVLDVNVLREALQHLLRHHDALRLRYAKSETGWTQVNAEVSKDVSLVTVDLSAHAEAELEDAFANESAKWQASLSVEGDLVRFVHFDLGAQRPGRLLMAAHHLLMDGVSLRIVAEDLETVYRQLRNAEPVQLPRKTTSFQAWAKGLSDYATTAQAQQELGFWQGVHATDAVQLPLDQDGKNTVASSRRLTVALSQTETNALLQQASKAYNTQINDLLLTALVESFASWTGRRSLLINLEGHGREEILDGMDLTRTVGWFTSMYPVHLSLDGTAPQGAAIKKVKEQLRTIPNRGIGYGVLRYLSDADVQAAQEPQVSFNYLGQFDAAEDADALFGLRFDEFGAARGAGNHRAQLIDIDGGVIGGELQLTWTYSVDVHHEATITALAQAFMRELQALITHCTSQEAGGYTPSDFPLAKLTQPELDRMLACLAEQGTAAGEIENIYRLSPTQEGMLFHSLLAPEAGMYVVQVNVDLQGTVDPEALQQAWNALLGRHDVLRTSFHWQSMEQPLQVVHRRRESPVARHDWSQLADAEREARLQELLQADIKAGFDLTKAPLVRLALVRLASDSYRLTWTSHHLIHDGWSMPVMFHELFALYAAQAKGEQLHLKSQRPFSDYIAWLHSQEVSAAEPFWREKMRGFTAPTDLRVERARQEFAAGEKRDAEISKAFSAEATADLQARIRQHQLTLNTLVQGAWAILLSRYSGEADVVFGTTVSGRPTELQGAENMVGLFINTLPVRAQLSYESSVLSFLTSLQAEQAELREYEHTPLVNVQEWSQAPRDRELFESIVVLENYPIDEAISDRFAEMEIAGITADERTNYPLTVVVMPGEQLTVKIAYDRSRFDEGTVERMAGHLLTLLGSMLTAPEQAVKSVPMVTEGEIDWLRNWNSTGDAYAADSCLHQLFEAQAAKTPDRQAVSFEGTVLTYRELNERANQLAHYLRSHGVGPESLVGLCVERSLETVVGVLAILKSGGAYVPLDPSYPQERLAFVLEDAQVQVLLTKRELAESLQMQAPTIICFDHDAEQIAALSTENVVSGANADNLAYVIYTSGSTGKPKGVLIPHGNAVRLFSATEHWYRFDVNDVWTLFHSYAFDFSVWEIWGALLYGGKVVVVPYYVSRSPEAFYQLLIEEKVTVLNQTPSAFRQLIAAEELAQAQGELSLRYVIFGGEALELQALRPWYERHGDQKPQLINMYGITETTVHVTYRPLSMADVEAATGSVIGVPIPDLNVYVLDQHLNPVPLGVIGEMYVGGAGVARGYLNRPELTDERFIDGSRTIAGESRLYKTGDLARLLSTGDLEYQGRIDHQVKIRGFRIELGEIESTLAKHEQVREAVVIVREDAPGDKRLVGYVVADAEVSPLELRQYLQDQLPDYMVPAAFVQLDAFPLTGNGKVDTKALPKPDLAHSEAHNVYIAPRTPVEELVAGLWADVLGVEQVGAEDNFFDLGGHSLLATQVISRLYAAFVMHVPLRTLFEAPTVNALAAEIEALQKQAQGVELPPITRLSRDEALPLSFAQQRLWVLDQLKPGSTAYNMSYAVRLDGDLNTDALERALSEIVNRHEALRTTFGEAEGQPLQTLAAVQETSLKQTDLSLLSAEERDNRVQQAMQAEANTPYDLSNGPLVRFSLLKLETQAHVLILGMHHIVSDGWSAGVFIRELSELYAAFAAGQPSPLAELPVQYADFAAWQRQWLQGDVLDKQLSYWKAQLGGELPVLQLQTDRPRPPVQTHNGATERFGLPQALTADLQALSRRQGVTLFMTLLAAFQTLLSRYSGQEDISVGTPIAGRNSQETEDLIGFFVNTLVMRTDLSGTPTFTDLLSRVRETALGAYAHQDVSFEKLVEELQPERDTSRSPLFQVLFALQNAPMGEIELPGVTLQPLHVETSVAKFDLTLSMTEQADGIAAELEYNTDLFDRRAIQRMAEHLQTLLASITSNPEQRISDLQLLPEEERNQVLLEWNATKTDYPRQACLHELFEAQAAATPDAIALLFGDETVTYGELNRRANKLARTLQKQGVTPGLLVGICMERSVEMIAALVAIVKAGGAYVPLDPTYPAERLSYMMQDANIQVLITQEHLLNALPETQAAVVLLAPNWEASSDEPADNVGVTSTADHLAYVTYTSGSTGKPKGVCIPQRAVARLVKGNDFINFKADEVFLQFASISFDAATLEIWGALLNGARLAVYPAGKASLAELGQVLRRHQVTTLWLTAGLFHQMVDEHLDDLASVRQMLAGGDVISPLHVNKLLERLPNCTFINGYGPTESTTFATTYALTAPQPLASVPIGSPIKNTTVYVLDQHLQPVPVGVAGELFIGGDGLAREYLNQPELTAERFIPSPFAPSERLYKTGDRVRWLVNGTIEFLDRIDQQVKIRGFRIELGEIEAVLATHERVQEVIVIAREDAPGDKRLVAYAVPQGTADAAELRAYVKQNLPDYMVPSAIVLLDAMPLTENGKVDRRALPAPDGAMLFTTEYVAPTNELEAKVAAIWAEILRIEQVGIHNNFFELGGHSLMATQIISKVRSQWSVELPLLALFEAPTIAEFAALIEGKLAQGVTEKKPMIQRRNRK